MKPFSMPKSLHDVFGESQTVFSLLLVLFGGVVFTLVFIFYSAARSCLPASALVRPCSRPAAGL